MTRRLFGAVFTVAWLGLFSGPSLLAQGVTTSSITGIVTDANRSPLAGANVVALHEASGTTYSARTRGDGRVSLPGMRVGGPYKVTATYIGFQPQVQDSVLLVLGVSKIGRAHV